MIVTVGYFLLVALTAVALNVFLVVGLVVADVLITGIIATLIMGYWQKEAMNEMSGLFEEGGEESLWDEESVNNFLNEFDNK